MSDAKRIASERRVSRAVSAIGKLNVREFREALAVVDARWLAEDEIDNIVPGDRPVPSNEFPLATQLGDPDEAHRAGLAFANLLELSANDYPGDQIRFDTVHGDRTYEGLARIVARVFEDPQFALELARRSQS